MVYYIYLGCRRYFATLSSALSYRIIGIFLLIKVTVSQESVRLRLGEYIQYSTFNKDQINRFHNCVMHGRKGAHCAHCSTSCTGCMRTASCCISIVCEICHTDKQVLKTNFVSINKMFLNLWQCVKLYNYIIHVLDRMYATHILCVFNPPLTLL